MDQVKNVLRVLGKHHFWVLTGVIMLVALVIYTTASGNLASRYEEREQQLDGKLEAARQIGSGGPPPNNKSNAVKQADIGLAKDDVLDAWIFLHKEQKANNPWPKELGEDFLMMINSRGPGDEIPYLFRDLYRNFIYNHYPELFEIIDIRKNVLLDEDGNIVHTFFDFSTPGLLEEWQDQLTAGLYKQELSGKVVWENPEVLSLGASWSSVPGTPQVRLAQEDLWVYEALLRIVRDTNQGATSYHNAAIKHISAMHIGKAASAAFATTSSAYSAGGDDDDDYESYDDDDDDYGGGGDYYATTGMDTEAALRQGRYVNEVGEPLAHDAVPSAEFKMMPVRLILTMDERKIPDLLANCANSSMPVEVKQVTIRPELATGVLDMAAMSVASGTSSDEYDDEYDDEDYGDDDDDDYGDYSAQSYASSAATQSSTGGILADSMDLAVEIRGVIFIFNPPDRATLGTGTAADGAEDTVAPVAQPEVDVPVGGAPIPGAPATTPPAEPAAGGSGAGGAPGEGT